MSRNRSDRMKGAYTDILLACTVIVLPMLALSGALLGLIFHYRVTQSSDLSDDLQLFNPDDPSNNAYLVDFNATRLITVASWTSSVAPLLPVFVMTLYSYSIARRFLRSSRGHQTNDLPTPYQLSLYLGLLGGGVGALWNWIKYRLWRRRERVSPVVNTPVLVLVLATILGFCILAADTWLHVTTETVPFSKISPTSFPSYSYGRGVYSDSCTNLSSDATGVDSSPCNINIAGTSTTVVGASEAYQTVNNLSSTNRVSTFTRAGDTIAYLADARQASNVDFQASTFAIQTYCQPVSQSCSLTAVFGTSTPFDCTPDFSGDVTAGDPTGKCGGSETVNIGITLFEDDTYYTNISVQSHQINPFYLGTWARVYANPFNGVKQFNLDSDPEIITPIHGGLAWVLECTSTVYDLTYSWINGSFYDKGLAYSNGSISQILAAPFPYGLACSNLNNLAITSSFSNTADEMAEKWSTGFSQIAMALAAGIMSERENIQEQSTNTMLVARVPKAPLFTLIALNLLYALLGILLMLYVVCFAKRRETRDVQARLSLAGLTAFCFEDEARTRGQVDKVENLFEEREGEQGVSSKVGIVRTEEGGWKYTLLAGR